MNTPLARRALLTVITLGLAALACDSPFTPPPDTAATVNAISTSVQQTLEVEATLVPVQVTVITANTPTPIGPTATPLINNPTPQPSAVAPTPTTGPLTRPNGEELHALHASLTAIDGDVSEWGELPYTVDDVVYQPNNWLGPADQSVQFALAWDVSYLYLAAHVTDDAHVQTQLGELIFRGDSLEILLDSDLAGDFNSGELSADDYQLGLTPGAEGLGGPEAYVWFPASQKGPPANVKVSARPDETGNGYYSETAIPWATFGLAPSGGEVYGFALSSSDNDTPNTAEQQSMMSSSPARRLTDPMTWGTLILDE